MMSNNVNFFLYSFNTSDTRRFRSIVQYLDCLLKHVSDRIIYLPLTCSIHYSFCDVGSGTTIVSTGSVVGAEHAATVSVKTTAVTTFFILNPFSVHVEVDNSIFGI
jgi:hypothetical protein